MGKRHSRPSIQGKYVMGIAQNIVYYIVVTPRFVSLNPNKLLLFNSFRTSLIHSNLYFLVIQLGFRVNPPKVKTYIPNACCAMFWVTWCDILRSHRLLSCMNFQRRMMGFFCTGGCVIINDTSSQTRLLEEILKQKRTVTSYEGYLVNEVSSHTTKCSWQFVLM